MLRNLWLRFALLAIVSSSLVAEEPAPKTSPAAAAEAKPESLPVDPAAADVLKKLDGKWNITSVVKYGNEVEAAVKLGITFTFADGTMKLGGYFPVTISKVVQVNPETTPKLLDFADSAADMKARKNVWEGIYEFDGDTLKWAIVLEGDLPANGARAVAVESKVGSNVVLVTLQRAKE
jgi:uncharacterized protein (TIGR03067 family)